MTDRYYDATDAAAKLKTSRPTICRAAKSLGLGIYVKNRLVALTASDIAVIEKNIHRQPGNPEWIAASRKSVRQKS